MGPFRTIVEETSISADDRIGVALFHCVQNVSIFLVSDLPKCRLIGTFDDKSDPLEASYQDAQGRLRDAGFEVRRLAHDAPQLGHEQIAYDNFKRPTENSAHDFARGTRGIRLHQVANVEAHIQENAHWSLLSGCRRAMPIATLLYRSNCHFIGYFNP